jgi:hypothetical protein
MRSSLHLGADPAIDSEVAKENEWGYTRIFLGELEKLGIRSISRNTVKEFSDNPASIRSALK